MVKAALWREVGKPLEIVDLDLADTNGDQVRVRIEASGVCHSDLSMIDGLNPYPAPALLGHEATGIVTEIGDDVTRVAVGDRVLLAWTQPCRECFHCLLGESHLCERSLADGLSVPFASIGGDMVYSGLGAGSWAEETLVRERAVVKISDALPPVQAALLGCAVTTGLGAALNTAEVAPGDTVAVIGCGGVGLSVVQGARIAGAERIIAIDLMAEKLAVAKDFGATDTIDGSSADVGEAVRELTGGRGVDKAFEVVGLPATIKQAYGVTRRGGMTVVVGAGGLGHAVEFDALELFYSARTLIGSVYGSSDPDTDFPRYERLVLDGELELGRLVSDTINLEDINDALDRMRSHDGLRSVITFD